jgi:hypothetical protein
MQDEIIPAGEPSGKPKKFSGKYPVKYHVGTVPVRTNNILTIYIPENAFAKLAKIVSDTGLSAAKVLAISSQPCECCRGKSVSVNIEGESHEIPRGLFTAKRSGSGVNVQKKKRSGE